MRVNNRVLFFFLVLFSVSGFTQVKYSNEFLNIGVGARSLGMGNTGLAYMNDVTANYWNPSSLVYLEDNLELGLMHTEHFAGIASFDYGAVGFKLDSVSNVGISVLRFGVDDIPNTLDLVDANGNVDFNRVTSFSSSDNAFLLSYARRLPKKGLSIGANAKVIYRKVGDFASAMGFGIDLSATYRKNNWRIAGVLRDATSTFNAWKFNTAAFEEQFLRTGNEIPEDGLEVTVPKLIGAVGYLFKLPKEFEVYPEGNLEFTFDGKRNVLLGTNVLSVDARFGFEANYKHLIYLRGGINNIQSELDINGESFTSIQPNFGVGVKFKKVALDYALTDVGDQSASVYSNVFSLRIGINKRK